MLFLVEMKGVLASGVLESLAEEAKENIGDLNSGPWSLPVITCAASLAQHRYEEMRLDNVDLTSVRAEHLASLVSSVAEYVSIKNILGGDLITILDSVKSKWLDFSSLSLGSEQKLGSY